MKQIAGLICIGALWAGMAVAQSPVTVTVDTRTPGAAIPADFLGLSFETKALLPDKSGAHLFNRHNKPLVTLFQNLGLTHLRVGGETVDSPARLAIPGESEIDDLFGFAWVAGVSKVIYSLRLMETESQGQYAETNAAIAKYICKHYSFYLEDFAIGNEPNRKAIFDNDLTITDYATFYDAWQRAASRLTAAVPEAKLAGPDAGSAMVAWTTDFPRAEKNSGRVRMITEHFYPGFKGKGVEARKGIDDMLSPAWVRSNEKLYNAMAAVVLSIGFSYRFTEANDHYSGGVAGASDTFAAALWALDFLHWWAAHGASGVDFHNKQWLPNDTITLDRKGQPTINPKAYGIKAFDLGSHGRTAPVVISNPDEVNLTAYAVRGAGSLFVTLINKEHDADARAADVTIVIDGNAQSAEVIFLAAANGNIAAKTGVTLGGAPIGSDGPWQGKWTPVSLDNAGRCVVKMTAASAVVVKIAEK